MYRFLRRIIPALLVFLILLSFAAAEEAKPVKSIKIKTQSVTITYGTTYAPEITISPEDATNTKLEWASTDESVCTVNDNNELVAANPGQCEISFTTTDGSNKTAKVKVTVPVFDEPTVEYTATGQDEQILPLDLHGFSLDNIEDKPSNDKAFLYYIDEAGIHLFPFAKGKSSITLTNTTNKKDKQVITITVPEDVLDDTPRAVVVLDKRKLNPGDKVTAKYAVTGMAKPFSVAEIHFPGMGSAQLKNTTGSYKYTVPSVDYRNMAADIQFCDSNGLILKAESNSVPVDHLTVVKLNDPVAVQRGKPVTVKYRIDGGSGDFQVEFRTRVYSNELSKDKEVTKGKFTCDRNCEIEMTFDEWTIGYWDIKITDRKNKKMQITAEGNVPLTDGWECILEYSGEPIKAGEPFRVCVMTNDISKAQERQYTWQNYNETKDVGFFGTTIIDEDGKYYLETVPVDGATMLVLSMRGGEGREFVSIP